MLVLLIYLLTLPSLVGCTVTLQGYSEERLIREILGRRNNKQILARPVASEDDVIEVDFSVKLHQIVKVVRYYINVKQVAHGGETAPSLRRFRLTSSVIRKIR